METQVQEREEVITANKDDIKTLISKYKEQNVITITSKKIKTI